jgi:hypothetical protein
MRTGAQVYPLGNQSSALNILAANCSQGAWKRPPLFNGEFLAPVSAKRIHPPPPHLLQSSIAEMKNHNASATLSAAYMPIIKALLQHYQFNLQFGCSINYFDH